MHGEGYYIDKDGNKWEGNYKNIYIYICFINYFFVS